ncbi:hypothetical protein TrispH2_010045 [Trichoplax sp. H2]|nr:hypothetical protein TrispH2_010045 [Trichoplax sp. H2]|eukprot:RDD37732.1 hypothetical protein TrispH2_010045 [Trichoplax sp. H2]
MNRIQVGNDLKNDEIDHFDSPINYFLVSLISILYGIEYTEAVMADKGGRSPSCEKCIHSIQNAISYLNKTSTREEVQKFFTDFCSTLELPERIFCIPYVKKYFPRIVAAVNKIVNPLVWCQSWGSCVKSVNLKQLKNIFEILSRKPFIEQNQRK